MRLKSKIYLVLASCFLLAVFVGEIRVFFASPFSQEIDAYLKEKHFRGVILIAKEGEVLFNSAYGMADEEHAIPNTLQTIFRIGSLTKQFTAASFLQLQEK